MVATLQTKSKEVGDQEKIAEQIDMSIAWTLSSVKDEKTADVEVFVVMTTHMVLA